jgi:hypothetical protein
MKRVKLIVVLAALIAGLAVSGLALAQASPNFDLGCSGVLSTAGGVAVSPTFRLFDSLGQTVAGRAASPNFRVQIGYIQNWSVLEASTAQANLSPAQVDGVTLYFPFAARFVAAVRQCSW